MKRHELLQREVHDASSFASFRARPGAGCSTASVRHQDAEPILAGRFFVPLVPFCRRTDGELLSAANDALQQLTQVPADYVDIRITQGWISMRGTVDWDWQREAVVSAMRRLVGVAGVGDGIEIRPAFA
ncbi:MAG: BON domain-containing protein [Zoogloea sp.]|nr:BON domain-containing protein [Zoogloea sp.]